MRLSEAIERLAIATRADGRSSRTVDSYRQKLKPLLAFLGDVHVEEISIGDLRGYVASLWDRATLYADHPTRRTEAGSLSPFTISSLVRNMKRLFNFLDEEGIVESSPARRIRTPAPKRERPKGIARQDLLALLATTEAGEAIDRRDRAIVYFLADTGCRVGGLCGLRLSDVDLDRRLAAIREKGGKVRFVPFLEATARTIRDWLEKYLKP